MSTFSVLTWSSVSLQSKTGEKHSELSATQRCLNIQQQAKMTCLNFNKRNTKMSEYLSEDKDNMTEPQQVEHKDVWIPGKW